MYMEMVLGITLFTDYIYSVLYSIVAGDLWGPLVLCMFMAIMLQSKVGDMEINNADGGPQFATFFLIYWVGALVITFNAVLLGGSM